MSVSILIGDCRERMRDLPDASVDSVVCDPPYHLTSIVKRFGSENAAPAKVGKTGAYARVSKGFMGQTWDGGDVAFDPETWAEVLRVLKPGGHLLAFSSTRTYHRMAVAIEDAGFEIRDCIFYCYGSGFPKSHNINKVLDAKKERCSCDESLRDVRNDLGSGQSLPSSSQQDLQPSLHGQDDIGKASGPDQAAKGQLLHLRQASDAAPAIETAQAPIGETVLQPSLLGADQGGTHAPDCAAGFSEPDTGELRQGGNEGAEKSSLEGRRDAQEGARQLSGRSVCEGTGLGASDGEDERLHNGASASDGADVRLPSDPNGSGQPQGPQPREQPPVQSGTLADERGSQARGSWPLCGGCGKPIVPEGLGTALKPAVEPICLARKPISEKNIAANVLEHGTGALNIDGCRIAGNEDTARPQGKDIRGGNWSGDGGRSELTTGGGDGRWPANLCHDGSEEVLAGFPETGLSNGGTANATSKFKNQGGGDNWKSAPRDSEFGFGFGDSGSAARFFYCAKATTEERGEGNNHPTVKPIALMRWLCRLVTPKGGTILDPFAGSGSTLIAADMEQFNAIGCEMSPEYAAIIERRVRDAAGMFADIRVDGPERRAA